MNKIELWEFVDKKSKEHLDFENKKLPEYLEMAGKDIPEEKRADASQFAIDNVEIDWNEQALKKWLKATLKCHIFQMLVCMTSLFTKFLQRNKHNTQ